MHEIVCIQPLRPQGRPVAATGPRGACPRRAVVGKPRCKIGSARKPGYVLYPVYNIVV